MLSDAYESRQRGEYFSAARFYLAALSSTGPCLESLTGLAKLGPHALLRLFRKLSYGGSPAS